MRKLVLFLGIILIAFSLTAQRTITDDVEGAETVTFTAMNGMQQMSVLFTNVGGTTEGDFTLEGSVDGVSYSTIQPTAGLYTYFPSDTANLTGFTQEMITTDVLLIYVWPDSPFSWHRGSATGASGDTTTVTIKWSK